MIPIVDTILNLLAGGLELANRIAPNSDERLAKMAINKVPLAERAQTIAIKKHIQRLKIIKRFLKKHDLDVKTVVGSLNIDSRDSATLVGMLKPKNKRQ